MITSAHLFNAANWLRLGAVSDDFRHLDTGGRAAAWLAGETRRTVMAATATAVLLSWLVLAWMAASLPPEAIGPGGGLIAWLPLPEAGGLVSAFLELCLSPFAASGPLQYAALAAMWFLTSVAMMLPSAAPMIRTYCEIADTAAAACKAAVHPAFLIAGYLTVWLAAALAFAAVSLMTIAASPTDAPTKGIVAAAALGIAGLWQFSSLKEACLTKCRAPFATLFANWSNRAGGVYRLGLKQGLWCLGCCWALMLVMFAVGIMNLFWMALIGLFAVAEKTEKGRAISLVAGTILLVWAAALLVVSL
ncbi:MAG: DUF2182 domain-containing protein [Rhizobiaceae bacterium]|nr:DUF2182 domain-containing protein [Rhizobiaceae bacterium]